MNLNDSRSLQPKSTRGTCFSARYDLTRRITAFADFNYYKSESFVYRDADIYQSTSTEPS